MVRVHSFDVFDTCLVRKSALPSGIFYDVAERIFAKLGLPSTPAHLEDFVVARIDAENKARAQASRNDITLEEIWRILTAAMGWSYDPALPLCELEAEADFLVPIDSTRKQIKEIRQKGGRIVFLSDMYLPAEFIVGQLLKHGIAEKDDGFYVSSEVGETKFTGKLFQYMLAREKVSAQEVVHTGDHPNSDYRVPNRMGIQARHFTASELTETEAFLMKSGSQFPDMGRIVGAMRAFRLGRNSDDEDMTEVVSEFVAPFVMGFATWVLQKARQDGIRRLYFLSRDCQIVHKVAAQLAPQFGDIECRYLYISRQACFLPSATAISPEGMPWMMANYDGGVLNTILAKIDLKYEDVESTFGPIAGSKRGAYNICSEHDRNLFWSTLNQPELRSRLVSTLAMHRESARRYMQAQGLFDSVPWALVDFGWQLSCQKALVTLLRGWGRKEPVKGYYLGLRRERAPRAQAEETEALFYQKPRDYTFEEDDADGIFSHIPLLEYVVGAADHPSVHHYETRHDGTTMPAYVTSVEPATSKFARKLHEEVLSFVEENPTLAQRFTDASACRNILSWLAIRFFTFPTAAQVRAVLDLPMAVDQNGLVPLPAATPLTYLMALRPLFAKWKSLFGNQWNPPISFWQEGSVALSRPGPRRLSRLLQSVARLRRTGLFR